MKKPPTTLDRICVFAEAWTVYADNRERFPHLEWRLRQHQETCRSCFVPGGLELLRIEGPPKGPCFSDEAIRNYVTGPVSNKEHDRFHRHFDTCAVCTKRMRAAIPEEHKRPLPKPEEIEDLLARAERGETVPLAESGLFR